LAADLGATRIEGDDFYAGGSEAEWEARSAQVKAELCMNWRRMRVECLEPLLAGQPISYHPYDFETGAVLAEYGKTAQPADVVILDGVYSCRPELADLVDFAILVELDNDKRLSRLQTRESEYFLREWFKRWDEAEQYYFGQIKPASNFELVIQNE
jgi:uridine kinase